MSRECACVFAAGLDAGFSARNSSVESDTACSGNGKTTRGRMISDSVELHSLQHLVALQPNCDLGDSTPASESEELVTQFEGCGSQHETNRTRSELAAVGHLTQLSINLG